MRAKLQRQEQYEEEVDFFTSLGQVINDILSPSKEIIYTSDAPRILYANVSTLVPLLRSVIRHHVLASKSSGGLSLDSLSIYVSISGALCSVYKCGYIAGSNDDGSGQSDNSSGNSNVPIDEQCRRDFADFVASEEFEPPLSHLTTWHSLHYTLCEYLPLFDDAICTRVFTKQRIESIITDFESMQFPSTGYLVTFMNISAQLAIRSPMFAQRISFVTSFGKSLKVFDEMIRRHDYMYRWEMLSNTATVLDRTLSAASDVTLTAQQLLESDVVPLCCTLLRQYVVAGWERVKKTSHPSIVPVALFLRVLRVMTSTLETSPDFAVAEGKPRNPSVTQFVRNDGVRLLETLRGCSSIVGGREVLQELLQLHTLLVGMAIIPPATAATMSSDAQTPRKN